MTLFLHTLIYLYYKTHKRNEKLCVDYLAVVIDVDLVAVVTVVAILVVAVTEAVATIGVVETIGVAETIGAVVAAITTGILVVEIVADVAVTGVADVNTIFNY